MTTLTTPKVIKFMESEAVEQLSKLSLGALIHVCNADPAHVRYSWQAQAEAEDAVPIDGPVKTLREMEIQHSKQFNRRYYGNPEGKPEFKQATRESERPA